jgi:hypothetical protein
LASDVSRETNLALTFVRGRTNTQTIRHSCESRNLNSDLEPVIDSRQRGNDGVRESKLCLM